MAHNTRRLTDAGTVVGTSADLADAFRDIDETTTKALNGADGGTFTAGANITIGGAGVQIACPLDMNGAVIAATSTDPLTHGAISNEDDYIRLASGHSGRSRTVRQWMWPVISGQFNVVYTASSNNGAIETRYAGSRFMARMRVHDRATIDTVKVRWEVEYGHASLPGLLPKFRVIRVDTSGNIEALRPNSGLILDGFIVLPASYANVAAYEASNNPQTSATYTCTQNNVVDLSQYEYMVEIVDEGGSNAFPDLQGNRFHWIETNLTNILSLAPQ